MKRGRCHAKTTACEVVCFSIKIYSKKNEEFVKEEEKIIEKQYFMKEKSMYRYLHNQIIYAS